MKLSLIRNFWIVVDGKGREGVKEKGREGERGGREEGWKGGRKRVGLGLGDWDWGLGLADWDDLGLELGFGWMEGRERGRVLWIWLLGCLKNGSWDLGVGSWDSLFFGVGGGEGFEIVYKGIG
jgi:hypothetical protein